MNAIINPIKNFQIGQILSSELVYSDIMNTENFSEFCEKCLLRHQTCDWGDMPEEDKQSNDDALIGEGRIFSGYIIPEEIKGRGSKIWIITEWDRSVTTILYPSEY